MTTTLDPRYDPAAIEGPLYRRWEERGYFHVEPEAARDGEREPYVIVIPPPNVTAVLHAGHALNNTIQDLLVRWRRMRGRTALWVPGTDHAGIATQNVVERQLDAEGRSKEDLGRETFEERMWAFVRETGGTILEQLRSIGCSCDWERTRFTLDPGLSEAVREVFVRLHEKGLVYRGEYIINWCPRCLTALSNEEAEGEETEGRLWHLRYPLPDEAWGAAERAREAGGDAVGRLDDGRWHLTVSTTRPETMLGDTGVAVHPDDARYGPLVGAEVELPLTGRRIPVVADEFVDPEFGTGMVKVTPAHDPNDFEIGRRAGLEVLDVMTDRAAMGESAPERFRGMERVDAREAVLSALEGEGLLAGSDPHTHTVPHCYRCDTVVEPRLSLQWFVRMEPLARPALEASRSGEIRFTPERWRKVYEHWLENIRDWCISRQLWWGHRIPVWYCGGCDATVVAREDPDACTECGSDDLEQDPDVLDTWFSSWLWPFSVFGWPDETEDLRTFYPTDTLVTGPDILFFWVARMIMAGYEFRGEAPFTDVYLNGIVRDKYNRKMSKSLGNGIDPLEVVDRFGADALRWTLLSSAAVGTDILLDHEDLEAAFGPGRNLCNKLWNAGRFTLMSVGEEPVRGLADVEDDLELPDRWILSRLSRVTERVDGELERFRLHEAADALYHFFWGEVADWYLEWIKGRIRGEEGEGSRQAARTTLVVVLDRTLRLLHPFVPFVTTALWDRLPVPEGEARAEDLMVAPWPEPGETDRDAEAEAAMDALRELVTEVRSLRKEYNVPEGEAVPVVLSAVPAGLRSALESEEGSVLRLGRIGEIHLDGDGPGGIGAQSVLGGGAELRIPLEGLVDLDRERERLQEEIARTGSLLEGARRKLANEQFVAKAPAEVVEGEREKARSLEEQDEKLRRKLAELGGAGG